MDEYSKDGYKIFNLGGMTDINVNNSKYDGLNTFKLAFNPEVIEYVGDLELITSKTLYFMYRHARPMRRLFTRN
jgi:lipid II:glycine glycyltransferase (peptidoglycan interpeptide bridge formation enzyme)